MARRVRTTCRSSSHSSRTRVTKEVHGVVKRISQELRSKLTIVSHLANFAYDPFNYEFFRKLHIIDLFLDCLTEPCEKMVEYGIAGVCNCSPDPANAEIIAKSEGIPLIAACLSIRSEKIVLCAVTTLYYLCTHTTKSEVVIPSIIEQVKNFTNGKTPVGVQLKHTAQAFLDKLEGVCVD